MCDIGTQHDAIQVEPIEDPFREPIPEPVPAAPAPVEVPEPVGSADPA